MSEKTNRPVNTGNNGDPITGTGQDLYVRARKIIPGGTQLFSKRPELFLPDQWPVYYSRAKGIDVWDMDDRHYFDFASVGIGTSILGVSDPEINAAVIKAVESGSMSTLNCPEEVELAELMIELHPWAQQARFARAGGEAMAVAVRIARAASGRDIVALCGYHGWADWYLAANIEDVSNLNSHLLPGLEPAGVPASLKGSAISFRYNNIDQLESIVAAYGDKLAAIVMEPHGVAEAPKPGYLAAVRDLADRTGAVLIFDEVTSGWRMNTGGVHMTLGVNPDIAVFAKCISNGHPMAAIIGTESVMDGAQSSFISSAYWTEKIGTAAALATIKKHRRENVGSYLTSIGETLDAQWKAHAESAGMKIRTYGMPPLKGFVFEHENADVLTTLFTQEMLRRGFLAQTRVFANCCHNEENIALYLNALSEVFAEISDAIKNGDALSRLNGPVKHSHFQRLN